MEEVKRIEGQLSIWDIKTPKILAMNDRDIKIGDTVKVQYKEVEYIGKVINVYGPGRRTLNVIFDNKHTAFYQDNVKLIC